MECCICGGEIEKIRNDKGEVIWDQGNDAYPVEDGRCCNVCERSKVLPVKLGKAYSNET